MPVRWAMLALLILWGGGLAWGQQIPLVPMMIDHQSRQDSPADVSFLLDAPAGKDGFIRVKDGHLVRPDGGGFASGA